MASLRSAVLLVLLLACASAGPIADPQSRGGGEETRRVFVVNHGWHSALVVGRADIDEGLLPEIRDFPEADYLEIGWGDRDYYPAPDPGLGSALKAAFWSSGSVLHVVAFKGAVENYFPQSEIVDMALPDEALRPLIQFISDTFSRSDSAPPVDIRPGLYGSSRFYPAKGSFHLFRTCNTWVAEALRSAGLPVSPAYAITAGNLMDQVKQCCSAEKAPYPNR